MICVIIMIVALVATVLSAIILVRYNNDRLVPVLTISSVLFLSLVLFCAIMRVKEKL